MKKVYSFAITLTLLMLFNLPVTAQVIYLNFGSHNETTDPLTYTVSANYNVIKPILRQIADTIITKKAKWNMQLESNFIRGAIANDAAASSTSDIIETLDTSKYIEVDPHNHFNNTTLPYNLYNRADLVKLLDSCGIHNHSITAGGFLWATPNEDWTVMQNPIAGNTFTSYTWTPTLLWGAGSPGHTSDYFAYGVWKPKGPTISTFGVHQSNNHLTLIGDGCSNVIWSNNSADSISNNIIDLVNLIATGAISQTGFYTQTIMFNFKSLNASTAQTFINAITSIINRLQPYVDQGKIVWQTLSEKYSTWNSLHSSPGDNFIMTCTMVPVVASSITATPGSLSSFTATVGIPSAAQTFSVSAAWVTANVTIAAPSNFEVSFSSSSGFVSIINITPTYGSVANTAVYVRYNPSAAGSHTGNISILSKGNAVTSQTVTVSGTSTNTVTPSPVITVTPTSLNTFTTTVGTPSTIQTFTVSGVNLTSNITITAPSNFEVSLSSSSGFVTTSLNISPASGTIANTAVYARYNPSAAGSHTGSIAITSTGITTQTVSVSGTSTNTVTPAPAITVTPTSLNTFTTTVGTPSATQTFTVSGANLTANITIAASSNFEVSLSSSTGFAASTSIVPISGTVASTAVYIRYNPSAAGSHSGTISLMSTGVSTQTVIVSGTSTSTGIIETGSDNYHLVIFPNPTSQSTTINWQLAENENVKMELLDVNGKRIKIILDEKRTAGIHQKEVDMKNFKDGIYLVKMLIGEKSAVKKIVKISY